jgi:hypothetical protein
MNQEHGRGNQTMYRVKSMTGVDFTITRFSVEAIQEGKHSIKELRSMGLAWKEKSEIT